MIGIVIRTVSWAVIIAILVACVFAVYMDGGIKAIVALVAVNFAMIVISIPLLIGISWGTR